MARQSQEKAIRSSVDFIIKGIQEKKGKQIVTLNISAIENTAAKYFVICHGTSKPHVQAIAESIEDLVRESNGDKPTNREGFENAEWILIDYFDVLVHVFQEPTRRFYKLENLWADAEIHYIKELD